MQQGEREFQESFLCGPTLTPLFLFSVRIIQMLQTQNIDVSHHGHGSFAIDRPDYKHCADL